MTTPTALRSLALALTLLAPVAAQAADTNSLPMRGARSQGALLTPAASLLDAQSWELALTLALDGTVLRPEVPTGEVRGTNQYERVRWVDMRQSAHLQLAIAPTQRLELSAVLPVLVHYSTHAGQALAPPPDATSAIGDLRLNARFGILQPTESGVAWAIQGAILAPTGQQELFYGEKRARVELGTSVGYISTSNWRVDGWVGYTTGAMYQLGDQILGDTASVSAAFQQRFGDLVWFAEAGVNAVISAALPNTAPKRTSLEIDGGVRWFHDKFYVDGGLGFAPLDHGAAPQWRLVASVGTTGAFGNPGAATANSDIDRDGIPNDLDQCPTQAEDLDGFQDDDGCPDWDNDADLIDDTHVQCPNLAEDFDGVHDHDGCPEDDADGDGIQDQADQCPEAPEDFDGFQDDDGCPEPEQEDPGAQWRTQSLSELSTWFDTNSDQLSEQGAHSVRTVVLILLQNEGSITVQGHADDRGSDELNRDLSLRRANAVRDALIEAGIDDSRIRVEAKGPEAPISPRTNFGRSMNRRVTYLWN